MKMIHHLTANCYAIIFTCFSSLTLEKNQVIAMNYAPKLVPIPKTLIKFTAKFLIKN